MALAPPENTGPVREAHRFDEERLSTWMKAHVDGFAGPLQVRQFKGGQSNPTFWLGDAERAYVLRKKPKGELLQSAHAVDREYRVMKALADTDVPVARMYGLCEDDSVIGQWFYVMEYLPGRIFWNVQLPGVEPAERSALYDEAIRVLAAIHNVDVDAVGLGDFGRKGEYVARQVHRWTKQYQASQTETVASMDRLIAWLPENVPADDRTTLVHGDFRMDNLIFHPTEPRVLSVIDWELSTLGHPFSDLAYTCMLYNISLPNVGGLQGVDFEKSGIPSEQKFLERYGELTGQAQVQDFAYYKAFSLFRLAGIAQGVYARSLQGNASSENASMFGQAVPLLAGIACGMVGID